MLGITFLSIEPFIKPCTFVDSTNVTFVSPFEFFHVISMNIKRSMWRGYLNYADYISTSNNKLVRDHNDNT